MSLGGSGIFMIGCLGRLSLERFSEDLDIFSWSLFFKDVEIYRFRQGACDCTGLLQCQISLQSITMDSLVFKEK